MASKFRVFTTRNCDTVHLELMGDFDGKSAFKVLKVLKRNALEAPTRSSFTPTVCVY